MEYKWPKTTIDAIILEANQSIILIKRRNPPFQGYWALPGGFVELGERVEDAVLREAEEETGLRIKILKLSGVFSDPKRDPRFHTISIAYLCTKVDPAAKAQGGDDALDAKIFNRREIEKLQLAFDHKLIIQEALRLADRDKLW